MLWTPIRTFAGQGIEAPPTDPAVFVSMPDAGIFEADANRIGYVEICFDAVSVAGAPTDVTLGVWRWSDGHIDKLTSIMMLATELAQTLPRWLPFHGQNIWLTVGGFTAGTAPTFTGSARCRPIRP